MTVVSVFCWIVSSFDDSSYVLRRIVGVFVSQSLGSPEFQFVVKGLFRSNMAVEDYMRLS